MAAIFQIRRGTSGSKPTLLAEGELYVDQSSENLIIGVSGSKEITLLKLNDINTGSLHLTGDIRLSGSIYLGNETADNISALGVFTTNLVPSGDSTKDVGTSGSYWRNLYATNISGAIAATNGVISGSSQLDDAFEQIASSTHTLVSGSSQIIGILDSLNSFSASVTSSLKSIYQTTSSLNLFTASLNTSITNLNSFTQSQLTQNSTLGSYTSSVETRFTEIGNVSGSLIASASAVSNSVWYLNGFSSSVETRLTEMGVVSGSLINSASNILTRFNSFSTSFDTAFDISGTNVTIAGDLIVNGTTTQINSTQVNIGENILELNYGGSATEAGIYVKDASVGGSNVSGSILWDATTDYWKAGIKGVESKILLAGGDGVLSGSTDFSAFSTSVDSRLSNLQSTSASVSSSIGNLNSTTASLLSSVLNLNGATSSLYSSASLMTASISLLTSSVVVLQEFSGNVNSRFDTLQTYTTSVDGRFTTLGTYTGSVNDKFTTLEQVTSSILTWTGSVNGRLSNLESKSESVDTSITNINTFTQSVNDRFTTLGTYTGSVNTDLNKLHESTASLNLFTASAYVSFSLMTASIEDHEGRIEYIETQAGITVSYNFDAQFQAIAQKTGSLQAFTASADSRLNNLELTSQSLNSWSSSLTNIFATDAEVAAGYEAQGRGIVSGSSQLASSFEVIASSTHTLVSGSQQVIDLLPMGTISGSSQLSGTTITNLTITNLTTVNQTSSVVFSSGSNRFGDFGNDTHEFTGSVQISGSQNVIGNISATSFSGVINATNGVISSSAQITTILPTGVVSGSSQIDATATTNWASGIKTQLNTNTVISGSSQVNADSITNFDVNVKDKLNVDGVISGSIQILGGTNIVSASTDSNTIDFTITNGNITANLIGGVVSGSSQVVGILSSLNSFTSSIDTTIKTKLNVDGVISGSSQILEGSTIHSSSVGNYQFNSIGVNITSTGVAGEIVATGDITAYYSSDIRLKENITPIPNALEKVNQISGNTYDWKEGYDEFHSHKGNDVGVIAQEIEQILPQIVTNRDNGYKAVQYEKMIPLLIEAIKELSAKVDRLENK
jgi:hypothetical protein